MKHLVRTSTLLAIVVALLTLGLVAPASAATRTGSVTGVITLGGTPLKGVEIDLRLTGDDGFWGSSIATDTTDSKGAYSFTFSTADPEFSGHTILIKDPQKRIVNTSRRFTDKPGKTVTRNAAVLPGSSITSSVKRGDGATTQRLRVDVFGPYALLDRYHEGDQDVYETEVQAAADGTFAIKGLPAGDYFLGFVDESKTYFPQCYDNILAGAGGVDSCDGTFHELTVDSKKITVGTGKHVTTDPQVLSTKGQRISGTVTDTAGNPIKKADVTVYPESGPAADQVASSSTGSVRFGPLAPGRYRLLVKPTSPWASQWYDRKDDRTGATLVDVTEQDVSGLAIKLKSKAKIAATLTPGTGKVKVAVTVTRAVNGGGPSGTAIVSWGKVTKTVTLAKGKGTATLSGLPEGRRKITVAYSGNSSTAAGSKVFYATVK